MVLAPILLLGVGVHYAAQLAATPKYEPTHNCLGCMASAPPKPVHVER